MISRYFNNRATRNLISTGDRIEHGNVYLQYDYNTCSRVKDSMLDITILVDYTHNKSWPVSILFNVVLSDAKTLAQLSDKIGLEYQRLSIKMMRALIGVEQKFSFLTFT